MNKLLLGIAASALLTTGALAHTPAPAPVEPAPTYNSAGFDWDGFYTGIGLTGLAISTGTNAGMADIIAGVNVTSGDVLFGVEAWVGGWSSSLPSSGWGGGVEGRVGYLIAPEALIYLSGGGYATSTGGSAGTVGLGAEFAATDALSVDLEYKYWMASGATGNSIGASLNWGY